MFGRNNSKQVSTLMTDKLADTKCKRMEHLSLSETTIRSKYLSICIASWAKRSLQKLTKQALPLIDQDPLRSQKNGNKMSVDFGWHADEKLE